MKQNEDAGGPICREPSMVGGEGVSKNQKEKLTVQANDFMYAGTNGNFSEMISRSAH